MNYDFLVDLELDRIDWTQIQDASGSATSTPSNFRLLLAATNSEEIKSTYWKLENHVVVQGRLYEAADRLVPAICASLVAPNRSLLVRTWVIELLFQICNGYDAVDGKPKGIAVNEFAISCKKIAKNALWLLYGELAKQEIKIVESLIALLEDDPDRLAILKKKIPNYKAPVWSTSGSQ